MSETIDTYEGDATVIQQGREIRCRCEYTVEQDSIPVAYDETIPGLRSWSGTIRPVDRLDLGEAELRLKNGNTGTIIIHAIEMVDVTTYGDDWRGSLLGAAADFQGTGPAPLRSVR